MRFNNDFFRRYLEYVPAALALERSIECEVHCTKNWEGPILDLGCGDGIFAEILFAEPVDVGVDPNPEEIKQARKTGAYKELIECFGDDIPKPDNSYSTVFSNSVLEHIPNLEPVLKEVHRVIKENGRFYITVPSGRLENATIVARILKLLRLKNLSNKYCEFYNRFWRHYNVLDEKEWQRIFESAGFEVESQETFVSPNLWTLCDMLTPLALPSKLCKSLLGRWIIFPRFRRLTIWPISKFLNFFRYRMDRKAEGCLIYFSLVKR